MEGGRLKVKGGRLKYINYIARLEISHSRLFRFRRSLVQSGMNLGFTGIKVTKIGNKSYKNWQSFIVTIHKFFSLAFGVAFVQLLNLRKQLEG